MIKGFDGDSDPNVIVTELGSSAVGLNSRAYINDPAPSKLVHARSEWVEAVKNRFDEKGYEHALPLHRTHRHARH